MEMLVVIFIFLIVLGIIGVILEAIAKFFRFVFEIICEILCLIIEFFVMTANFIKKHIVIILGVSGIILASVLLFVYVRESEEPFAFIPKTWNYIMYGHDVSGIIVGGVVALVLNIVLIKLSRCMVGKHLKLVNVSLFLPIIVLAIMQGVFSALISAYIVGFLLFEVYKREIRYIFGKEEVSHIIPIKYVRFSWNFVSILYSITAIKVPIDIWNQYYNTNIQPDILILVFVMLVNLLLAIGIAIALCEFTGIRQIVKKMGIFDYGEMLDWYRSRYDEDFVTSILDNMKHFIVKSEINENEWMTQRYLYFWKKNMQQGKRMKEIEDSYEYSLHNQTFRDLYVKMYKHFHGIYLDFPKIDTELDGYYKRETMFRLFRYKIAEHPVLLEKSKFINRYLLNRHHYVRQFYRECTENLETFEPEFMQLRWLEGLCKTDNQRKQLKSMIKKQNYPDKSLTQGKGDYLFLLILEVLYFVKNYVHNADVNFQFEKIEELAEAMGLSTKKNVYLYRFFIHGVYKFDRDKLCEVNADYFKQFHDSLPDYFVKQLIENEEYEKREETHIAICATVKCGKSTLLNTILGKDLMPNQMTVCTARMNVIRTNDCLQKSISVIESKDLKCQYEYNISLKKMNEVNQNENVKQILTEVSVPLLRNANKIIYFHDSPGVNNSMDEKHHEVTINYLITEKPEWIFFLIDAEHDTVNDNISLLKEVAAHAQKKSNVIFIYNKVDCLKEEDGDDLDENLHEVREMIRQHGFSSPRIFPISAKSAQLFAEILADRYENFTDADKRMFRECYQFFKKKKNNMMRYFEEEVSSVRNKEYEDLNRDEIVVIKDKEYKKGDILDAWYRTGIYALEEWILQYIAGKEEKI